MEVLPVPYFHAVFTLPHALNALVAANRTPLLGRLLPRLARADGQRAQSGRHARARRSAEQAGGRGL